MTYEPENTCYVLPRTQAIHPIAYDRHDFIWYPETSMTLIQQMKYLPYIQSIITENPWLISVYSRENVRVWDKERGWVCPNTQTFGADINTILSCILGFDSHISQQVLDGCEGLDKQIIKLERQYVHSDNKG